MINSSEIAGLAGNTMVGQDGSKIGKIVDVYESTEGADGTFVTVATGLFGSHSSFVPLAQASLRGDEVVVPYDKALIKDAPRVEIDEELSAEEEDRLYQHYSLTGTSTAPAAGKASAVGAVGAVGAVAAAVGRDTSPQTTPAPATPAPATPARTTDDDAAMTRSEERLRVGTEQVEVGRAKLRKRIVTETQTVVVPVSHTEARVIREPITAADQGQALGGLTMSEEEREVVLTRDVPVVEKEVVAVERIRLEKETVTEQAKITEQVRKEQIEQVVDSSVPPQTDRQTR